VQVKRRQPAIGTSAMVVLLSALPRQVDVWNGATSQWAPKRGSAKLMMGAQTVTRSYLGEVSKTLARRRRQHL